ncbi:MAG: TonB-dependent receptor [Caulobacteraceae bacterium]
MTRLLYSVSAIALLSLSHTAQAQTAEPAAPQKIASTDAAPATTASLPSDAPLSTSALSEVIVTGTRQTGIKAVDSAAPIQVVGSQAFQHVGQPSLQDVLQQNVPSFNVQQYGADTAALTVQAALRGLNPNDTLVLVDGKRRNATANLSVDSGSPYSGSATVDLSLIPVGAIDHVEVLTDGAAAQYGSDAIAGVVNIILKNADHGGSISATGGEYFEGDGETGAAYVNKGFNLGDKGFVNVTLEDRYHDFSHQGGADRRLFNPDGSLLSSIAGTTNAGVLGFPGQPNVNRIYGDTQYQLYDGFYNAGYNVSDALQLYSFGSYANRTASAFENYRVPNVVEGVTSTGQTVIPFPNGFNPREQFKEYNYSITGGLKGDYDQWHYDLSTTYGADHDSVYTINSANAAEFPILQAASATPITPQRDFYDGAYQFSEWTSDLDITRAVNLGFLASPLNVAVGAEYRRQTFTVSAGEPASFFGSGAQSFIGYTPTDAGVNARDNEAVYIDLSADPIEHLHLDIAGRYEHYSDFGDAPIGKVTARYDFTPAFAIRGTISDGFRAPTLQEEFYSGTNVGPTSAFVQLPANAAAAQQAGFHQLQPEKSTNFSGGFVAHPISKLQVTVDYYHIDLQGRILNSGSIIGLEGSAPNQTIVSQGVLNAIGARGINLDTSTLTYAGINIFSNAADTTTQGVEATAAYASDFGDWGHVDWTVGFNYNETTLDRVNPLPAAVENVAQGQTSILTAAAVSALLTGTPKEKAVLNALWTINKFTVNLRETIYGSTSELISVDGTGTGNGATNLVVGAAAITDLDIGYKITPQLRLNIGANNLFDLKPPTVPNAAVAGGGVRPADGGNVFGEPAVFSPYGINGGYYYGRITYSF